MHRAVKTSAAQHELKMKIRPLSPHFVDTHIMQAQKQRLVLSERNVEELIFTYFLCIERSNVERVETCVCNGRSFCDLCPTVC